MKSKQFKEILISTIKEVLIYYIVFIILAKVTNSNIDQSFTFFGVGVLVAIIYNAVKMKNYKRTISEERKSIQEMNHQELISNVIEVLDDYINIEEDELRKTIVKAGAITVSKNSEKLQGIMIAKDIIATRYNFLFWNENKK